MQGIFSVIGRRIRSERDARGLTQQELADAAGLDPSHLSRIESGKTPPSISKVKTIADALGIPISKLFEDIPTKKPSEVEFSGKVGLMLKEVPPKKRAKLLRVLKSIVSD